MEKKLNILSWSNHIWLLGIAIFMFACNADEQAKLKVKLTDFANIKGVMNEQRITGEKFLDSVMFSSKGEASYKFELDQPNFYNLRCNNNKNIYLLLQPKDKVSISGTFDNMTIEGSEDTKKLMFLYDSLFKVRKALSDIKSKYDRSQPDSDKNALAAEYQDIRKKYKSFSMQFILDNLNSMVSLAALYQETSPGEFVFATNRDLQFYKLVSDSLNKYYPKHRHVLALKRNFNQMLDNYNMNLLLANADNIKEGLPELELPTYYGDKIALSSMQEKYVLLNFWSLNVSANKDYFPNLKKLYGRFSKKSFGIYNVYIGKSPKKWQKVVEFEEIDDFTNVADTSFPFSSTQTAYNITSLPTNYLIDLENKEILGKNMTTDQLTHSLAIKLE